MKRSIRENIFRYTVLVAGLVVMAFGVSFSIRADYGTSPISSLPYVLSLCMSQFTVGQLTIMMHIVMIALQIILLGRKYSCIQLMQLPVGIVFGYIIDISMFITQNMETDSPMPRIFMCAAGIVLVGAGVSMEVSAKAVPLAGEGLILAICQRWPVRFGRTKVFFDVTLVVLAVLIGLSVLGRPEGVGAGTVAAALLVGYVAKKCNRYIIPAVDRMSEEIGRG